MSIKEVARAAGVSIATVSHVINNTRYVTDETRARVTGAIKRLNYYPNVQARSLVMGRSTTLGLIVSDIANPFQSDLVKAIEDAAFERGYDVMLANTNYDAARTADYVRRFIERKHAGVMLMTSEMSIELIDELNQQSVPVVYLDAERTGINRASVTVDYEQGIDEAMRHLVELGHRRVALISGPLRLRSAEKRLGLLKKACRRHRLRTGEELFEQGDFQLRGGYRAAREILSANVGDPPTAIIASNDLMAIGAARACRELNLGVPRDVSIIGFDDMAFAEVADPPLTTIRLSRQDLGTHAVAALTQMIDHPRSEGGETVFPTRLIVRQSTGAVQPK